MGTPLQQSQQPLMLSGDEQIPMLPNDGMGVQGIPSQFKEFLSEFSDLTLTEFITIFSQISGTDPLSLSRDPDCSDDDDDDDDDDEEEEETAGENGQPSKKLYKIERQFLHEIFNSVTISELMDMMSGDFSSAFKVHV